MRVVRFTNNNKRFVLLLKDSFYCVHVRASQYEFQKKGLALFLQVLYKVRQYLEQFGPLQIRQIDGPDKEL